MEVRFVTAASRGIFFSLLAGSRSRLRRSFHYEKKNPLAPRVKRQLFKTKDYFFIILIFIFSDGNLTLQKLHGDINGDDVNCGNTILQLQLPLR